MSFIRDLGRHRMQARQANQAGQVGADGRRVEPGADGLRMPELPGGAGKPAPVRKAAGLSGAMMRQTVGDLFGAGEKLGLSGPLLARHAASFELLMGAMKELDQSFERALRGQPAETRELIRSMPARLIGAMSPGLTALDPANASASIGQVLGGIAKLLEGPSLPTGHQIRAMERIALAAAGTGTTEMGAEVKKGMELIGASRADVHTLLGATEALLRFADSIRESGGNKAAMFRVALQTTLAAAAKDGDAKALATQAAQANKVQIPDGQLQLIAQKGVEARQLAVQSLQKEQQLGQQLQNAGAQWQANMGAHGDKLGPIAGLQVQAGASLSAEAQLAWFQQVNANLGQPAPVVAAIATAALNYLSRAGQNVPPANVLQQISQGLVALSGLGVPPERLQRLASEHVLVPPLGEVPATLTQLANAIRGLSAETKGRLFALQNVEKDGSDGVTVLANGLANRTARYAKNGGPMPVLVAVLEGAKDEAALKQAVKNGPRFAAEIPDSENGPIVDLLRKNLPEDLAAASKAGVDLAVVASTHVTLPADSLGRFVRIGKEKGKDLDKWIGDLEKFFKNARGSKDNQRQMRNLIAIVDAGGGDATQMVAAFNGSKLAPQMVSRTISSMLIEANNVVSKEYADQIVASLKGGQDVLGQIEGRLHGKMMQQLNLNALMGDANVKVTPKGLADVKGPLATLFRDGTGKPQVDQPLLKGLLLAALGDSYDGYRFQTPRAETQIGVLSAAQKAAWLKPQTMMHVRFSGDGQARFDARVDAGAKLGNLLLSRMEESWGKLGDLKAKHEQLVGQLRNVNKNDRGARLALVRQVEGLPAKIKGLEWASGLAAMTPATMTPEKFLKLAAEAPDMHRLLGAPAAQLLDALGWTLRMGDISYSEVVSDDGPDMAAVFKMATTNCLRWPGEHGEVLAYMADANKRMIVTKNQGGEMRRALMRLVERQDPGHEGEPMLLLDRTYPDAVTQEEKQRLMEHTIRRAAGMGIACAFATEYYWDASKTGRRQIVDMNAVLEDLCKRYDTVVDKKIIKVMSRASNVKQEYLDSAPPNGAAGRGQVGIRRYGQQDNVFENEFVILQPK